MIMFALLLVTKLAGTCGIRGALPSQTVASSGTSSGDITVCPGSDNEVVTICSEQTRSRVSSSEVEPSVQVGIEVERIYKGRTRSGLPLRAGWAEIHINIVAATIGEVSFPCPLYVVRLVGPEDKFSLPPERQKIPLSELCLSLTEGFGGEQIFFSPWMLANTYTSGIGARLDLGEAYADFSFCNPHSLNSGQIGELQKRAMEILREELDIRLRNIPRPVQPGEFMSICAKLESLVGAFLTLLQTKARLR